MAERGRGEQGWSRRLSRLKTQRADMAALLPTLSEDVDRYVRAFRDIERLDFAIEELTQKIMDSGLRGGFSGVGQGTKNMAFNNRRR